MTLSNFRVEVPGQRSKAKDFILYDRNLRFVRTGYGNIDLIQSHSVEGLSLPFHSFCNRQCHIDCGQIWYMRVVEFKSRSLFSFEPYKSVNILLILRFIRFASYGLNLGLWYDDLFIFRFVCNTVNAKELGRFSCLEFPIEPTKNELQLLKRKNARSYIDQRPFLRQSVFHNRTMVTSNPNP